MRFPVWQLKLQKLKLNKKLFTDIKTLQAPSLDAYEIFYYAAYIDRVFVKIHTFRMVTDEQAGCRRNGFLLKKWERMPRDM